MKTLTFICIVVIVAMAAIASVVIAEEKTTSAPATSAPAQAVAPAPAATAPAASVPGEIRHLKEPMGDRESAANESEEADEDSAGGQSYDTYDPNTGVPDTTPSDSVGNLN